MFALSFILVSLLLAVPDRPMEATPKDTWVGKFVFLRSNFAVLDPAAEPRGLQPNAGEGISLGASQYRAYAERANHVQLKTRDGISGWVHKDDLVPLEDAVAFFTKQIEANPRDVIPYHRRASAWRFRGEQDAALKDMNEAMRLSPSSTAFNNRALIWHAKRDFDKAIVDYATAIDMDPANPLTHLNRANSYLRKGDFDKAIADAMRALALQARYPEANRVRGLAAHEMKDYDLAIADFTRVLELDPKYTEVRAERGNAHAALNKHAEARADFNEALRLEPTNVTASAAAAMWLSSCTDAKFRDGKRALLLARQAQKLERSNTQVLQALAAAHAELGQFSDAVRWQEHALIDPQLKNDKDALARLELYRNRKPYRRE